MARYKNGINGAFIGKIGKVVGTQRRGTDYMRSVPDLSTKEPTEKQVRQRKVLAMISKWLKPLKSLICIGFQIFTGGKTPMNQAFSMIAKSALVEEDGETKIDFKRVVLSRGELLVSFVTEVLVLLDALVHVKWSNLNASVLNNADDKATFVMYNPAKEQYLTFAGVADREAEQAELQLPASFSGDLVHCWMQYVNAEGNRVSTSVYLGEILIG